MQIRKNRCDVAEPRFLCDYSSKSILDALKASQIRNGLRWRPYAFTRFVLFFKDCDSSSGITNLRHTYGTITIHLKMNTFCFIKIDGLPAKFSGH